MRDVWCAVMEGYEMEMGGGCSALWRWVADLGAIEGTRRGGHG